MRHSLFHSHTPLQPGDYELQLRDCEPTTHRPVPARLRFHVPEPPTDYYANLAPLPASPSYEEISPIKMVEQSPLRRALASASATAAAVGPAVGSAAFTLLLTLLAVAVAALLMGGRGPDCPVKQQETEQQQQKQGGKEQAAVAAAVTGKGDGTPVPSSSQGTQIESTEENDITLEVPNPAVELPSECGGGWLVEFTHVCALPRW